jgi:hypothetical protein
LQLVERECGPSDRIVKYGNISKPLHISFHRQLKKNLGLGNLQYFFAARAFPALNYCRP